MSVGIRFVSLAEGQTWIRLRGLPAAGQWLMSYHPDARLGIGEAEFTPNPNMALRFDDFDAARAFWQQQSTVLPLLPNDNENRPLTVVSIEVDALP